MVYIYNKHDINMNLNKHEQLKEKKYNIYINIHKQLKIMKD